MNFIRFLSKLFSFLFLVVWTLTFGIFHKSKLKCLITFLYQEHIIFGAYRSRYKTYSLWAEQLISASTKVDDAIFLHTPFYFFLFLRGAIEKLSARPNTQNQYSNSQTGEFLFVNIKNVDKCFVKCFELVEWVYMWNDPGYFYGQYKNTFQLTLAYILVNA